MSCKERAAIVQHCRWVDEVIEGAPVEPTLEFLDSISAKYICASELSDHIKPFKEAGRFLPVDKAEGNSNELLLRIIRDYDEYVKREIEKGSTYKELNLSKAKSFKYFFINKCEEFKSNLP